MVYRRKTGGRANGFFWLFNRINVLRISSAGVFVGTLPA